MQIEDQDAPGNTSPHHPSGTHSRNPGIPLDLEWIGAAGVDESEVQGRSSDLDTDRRIGEQDRISWLLKAVSCIDLTTLSGDDTPSRIRRLCAEARYPIPTEVLEALGIPGKPLTTAAVCVYHEMVETALRSLEGSGIPVATVSAGFPHGLSPLSVRLAEIRASVSAGAQEIDTVIPRFLVLEAQWERLYHEVSEYRLACGEAHLKTILSTGELGSLENVYRTGLICMMAGADFIKTSTGKEKVNATLPVGIVMARTIRDYGETTGYSVGLKPAGGLKEADEALAWFALAKEELGEAWTEPGLLRFGASSLLGNLREDLKRQLSPG